MIFFVPLSTNAAFLVTFPVSSSLMLGFFSNAPTATAMRDPEEPPAMIFGSISASSKAVKVPM